jgi:branched-subunit amino acid ABC-type transport system permease component
MTLAGLLQQIVIGLDKGTTYALLGVGFALIIGVSGRFHIAYAVSFTLAAFVASWATTLWNLPFWPSLVLGALAAALFGVLIEKFVYYPLSRIALRNGTNALLMIFVASLGISISGRNLIQLVATARAAASIGGFDNEPINIGPYITLTTLQIASFITSWVLIGLLSIVLARTTLGRMIRAVRANWEMSLCVGVSPQIIYLVVFAIGSAFGGVAAVFIATGTSAKPDMGLVPMFYALVVAFVAGLGTPPLTVGLIGLALGMVESLSALFLPTQWTSVVVFAILLVYVAMRPVQLGDRIKKLLASSPKPGLAKG